MILCVGGLQAIICSSEKTTWLLYPFSSKIRKKMVQLKIILEARSLFEDLNL